MSTYHPVCTIDGPSGSGKGTIASLVAQHFGWHLLDSGAIYRVVAKAISDRGIALDDIDTIVACARTLELEFKVSKNYSVDVMLGSEDVSTAIRQENISQLASKVAAINPVREALVARQRDFRQAPGLVADGRDMGTIIFPDASFKFFLFASAEERAKRRLKQLKLQGNDVTLSELLKGIIERDERDSNRATAPLKPASDAISIDTTGMTIDEVKTMVIQKVNSG